jgi:hypothetical protein
MALDKKQNCERCSAGTGHPSHDSSQLSSLHTFPASISAALQLEASLGMMSQRPTCHDTPGLQPRAGLNSARERGKSENSRRRHRDGASKSNGDSVTDGPSAYAPTYVRGAHTHQRTRHGKRWHAVGQTWESETAIAFWGERGLDKPPPVFSLCPCAPYTVTRDHGRAVRVPVFPFRFAVSCVSMRDVKPSVQWPLADLLPPIGGRPVLAPTSHVWGSARLQRAKRGARGVDLGRSSTQRGRGNTRGADEVRGGGDALLTLTSALFAPDAPYCPSCPAGY